MANFLKSLFVKGVEIDPAGATSNQVLKYNGTKFVPGTASTVGSIDDLSDVVISTPSNSQVLQYNGTNWVNSAGTAGPTGPTGAQGPAATVAVGTVTAGTAAVTNVGTSGAAIFNFALQTGATGATGATGPTGATGAGAPLTSSATAPVSPSAGDIWFDTTTGASYIYYNSAWVELGGGSMSPMQVTSSTRPSSPWEGQMIYETDTDKVLVWNGSAWYANWNLPWGQVSNSSSSSSDTTISSEEVQITGSSFTAVTNRLYKISYFEPDLFSNTGANGYMTMRIRQTNISGTVLSTGYEQVDDVNLSNRIGFILFIGTFSSGSMNVVATLQYSSTSGHAGRASTQKAYLLVEDIGPA